MQAVILAGGLGTRLWPLTRAVPKPMVRVAGRPYLEHQLQLLKSQNISNVLILTGYMGEQIEEYFGDGSRLGISIRYSRESQPLGTAGALRKASQMLASTFILLYGDSYLPIKYGDALERLYSSGTQGVMVVYDNRQGDSSVKGNVDTDKEGYVSQYEKDYVEAGVLAFQRSWILAIPANTMVSLEKEIFPALIARRQLVALLTGQRFFDIGTPERLKAIEEFLLHDHYSNTSAR